MKNCLSILLACRQVYYHTPLLLCSRAGFLGEVKKSLLAFLLLLFLFFTQETKAQIQNIPLYFSEPGQSIDRIDPVTTADNTTASSIRLYQTQPVISVDATTTGFSANPGVATFTVSHTTGTANSRLMLVGISDKNRLVNSVTYGGVALTLVGESVSSVNAHMHIYRLLNPASGTANVVVTLSGIPDRGIVVGVTTFSNVDQANPLGTFVSATAKSTAASITAISANGELVYDVATFRNATMTPAAGQAALYNINSGNEIDGGGASTKPGAGSVTMMWNGFGNQDWAIGAVSIKPATVFNNTSFVQSTALCGSLIIKAANAITVSSYLTGITGSMPVNPNITAVLRYGTTNIITLTNPTYNSGTGLLSWSGTIGTDVTVPGSQVLSLVITNQQSGTSFIIQYDSQIKPSQINIPTSTYVDINSMNVYTAAYPGGSIVTSGVGGTTRFIRAVVSNPFGNADINGVNFTITPNGSIVAGSLVATAGCTRTYEYAWSVPLLATQFTLMGVAKQGLENIVTDTSTITYDVCTICPPVANNDSATGSGGMPVVVDALANDYDPNANINTSTLAITTQPNNGTGYIINGKIVYLPNGSYSGKDTITYRICDNTSLCATAQIFYTIDPVVVDPCSDATRKHTYYLPYPEKDAYIALLASSNTTMPSNNIRTVISITVPYPGMTILWDEWEDGYEANSINPAQGTTKVWGDGNLFNGIAPGFVNDLIPAGGSIVLDNTMPANPRVSSNIFYDGRDKVISSGQIALTQVCGEPTRMPVQAMKSNVTSVFDFGQSFTIPIGQNYPSRDFAYTALLVRAAQNSTIINIDKDNNGTFETTANLNEGESYLLNGGAFTGATVTSNLPVGVELNAGGIDDFSIRNSPIFPATWYSNIYYTPVPTSDNAGDSPKDSSVVMFYNSLNRAISINWTSGVPGSGSINIPAKTAVRFPLAYSTTAAYKFVNPTGESFTAIEIIDSYTPGGGGNDGLTYDWSFNLIAESRLTDYATTAWAPGGLDLVAPAGPDVNGNPIWVTPSANTTIYVKYNGNVSGTTGSISPCGLRYDVSYSLNALNYIKIRDPFDNDQSGIAIYTCNGAKIAAVYGADPQGSSTGVGVAYWDVGATIQPFCKQKLVFANDDFKTTLVGQPVTIPVLLNDFGFLATLDPTSVATVGLLQPKHGTVSVNANGTLLYTPNPGYVGNDTLEYQVCSTPSPIVCDIATVIIKITACPAGNNLNLISGQVFMDKNKDGINNDGGTGSPNGLVYLYSDWNCNSVIDANELTDSVTVDSSGFYQFEKNPEKLTIDDFDGLAGASTCATGSDGNTTWATNWVDAGDPSVGYCNNSQTADNTDAEIKFDAGFSNALRLKDNNVSATRTINLSGSTKAFLTFDYRRKSNTLLATEDIIVQASSNGTTFSTIYTIAGNGTADASYVTVYNQDITAYASATTYIRLLTNNNVDDDDTVYIDNVKVQYLKYSQCFITKINTTSIPTYTYLTTAVQRTSIFTSAATCSSVQDFGIAKNSITVSGTLYNDANGLVDMNVNGIAIGSPSGATAYAYLVDIRGKVAFKSSVNSVTGAYSFPLADVNSNFTLVLSTRDSAVFKAAPSTVDFAVVWASVGDAYGINNGAGTGVENGTPSTTIAVTTALANVTNVNFGIEQLPNSNNHSAAIPYPYINQLITLDGGVNPPVLSGSDPEDYPSGGVLSSKTIIIDTVPENAELYYNNVLVTNEQSIPNFNPSLLQVKVTDATVGDTTIFFRYSYVDIAGRKDLTPARYSLVWSRPLPADALIALVNLNGSIVTVKWSTLSEQNTDYFIVERSIDNVNFSSTGTQVEAAHNSSMESYYQMKDDISSITQTNIIYYRVKLYDIDGKIKYSNIVVVRLSQKPVVTIWPNPFQHQLTISILSERDADVTISLIDVNGKVMKKVTQRINKGITGVPIDGLSHLAAGMYLVEIVDKNSGTTYQKIVKSNN